MRSIGRSLSGAVALAALAGLFGVTPAHAGSAWWGLTSGLRPAVLPAGPAGTTKQPVGEIVATVQNRGDASANGVVAPITVVDAVPKGLKVVEVKGYSGIGGGHPVALACKEGSATVPVYCESKVALEPFQSIEILISVDVRSGAVSGEENTVSVSGGGVRGRTVSRPVAIGGEPQFGFEDYELLPEGEGGGVVTQAGSHPFQVTNVITLNQILEKTLNGGVEVEEPLPVRMPKNVEVKWPAGLIGNPTPLPQCSEEQFSKEGPPPTKYGNECLPETAVGVVTATYNEPATQHLTTAEVPLFNLTARAGEPARFGFVAAGNPAYIDASIRTGGDYGVTVTSDDITQLIGFLSVKVTVWGVPGNPAHDLQRGWECLGEKTTACGLPPGVHQAFLMMPTSCERPFTTSVDGNSWPSVGPQGETMPAVSGEALSFTLPESVDGCNKVPFAPQIGVTPDAPEASTATGLTLGVHIPQQESLDPNGVAQSSLRQLTVELPQGVIVNPSGADGLEACSEAQIGYIPEPGVFGEQQFTPGEPSCPNASKVGMVEIETPLLTHTLTGSVYLATPAPFGELGLNPFGSLLSLYVVAKDPISGVLIKNPVQVSLDPNTGRLIATSPEIPQAPFENLRLHMFGEDRAPLATPGLCGTYTTVASFTSWSGGQPVPAESHFSITAGPKGSGCPNPHGEDSLSALPFAPSLAAGTTNIQAGGFSQFTTTLSRADGNQDLQSVQLHMPPGLLGMVSSVKLCGEEQANAGTCGSGSLIGHTTVSVGVGGSPYTVTGGEVFLTGPYEGAPYGLSIVNPANAGPFHLGKVIVRAKIEVDPNTADLTVTTGSIPHILMGIPLEIQHVNVTIDRPGFIFNPTNCDKLQIGGTLTSDLGATANLSVPFQVTNCATLGFKPQFKVATSGKTSRKDGAGLDAKLSYPVGSLGKYANIRSVKVDLPKQLPSRLTTLQKACPDATFEQNPANCPQGSRVGMASATTPVLSNALFGPAYFVSHGGAKFPELVIVLQGNGVTVYLRGETFISKRGITSSTFHQVPDVPVQTFQLILPEAKNSALAANGNLCASKLTMPTAFTAQNGVVIHQSTPIGVTGCPKHKVKKTGKVGKTNGRDKRARR